ncbi:unnamed protein product, partial [Musa acuminata subsp. malaccensis]
NDTINSLSISDQKEASSTNARIHSIGAVRSTDRTVSNQRTSRDGFLLGLPQTDGPDEASGAADDQGGEEGRYHQVHPRPREEPRRDAHHLPRRPVRGDPHGRAAGRGSTRAGEGRRRHDGPYEGELRREGRDGHRRGEEGRPCRGVEEQRPLDEEHRPQCLREERERHRGK